MTSYRELLAQREKLERQIEEQKAKEFDAVIGDIKQKMQDYGIKLTDLGRAAPRGRTPVNGRTRAGVAPKYRDPGTGATWSGRGKPPRWIAGKSRDMYLIQK